jgi:hypothetical protein
MVRIGRPLMTTPWLTASSRAASAARSLLLDPSPETSIVRHGDDVASEEKSVIAWSIAPLIDVAQDHAEAAKWFCKAADQGLAEAQFNLGRMYANGIGVRKNDIRALG